MQNEQTETNSLATTATIETESKSESGTQIRITDPDDVLCPIGKNCIVCNSPYFTTVNQWHRQGKTLRDISALCTSELDMDASKDVLNRHFRRYNDLLRAETSYIAFEDFKREAQDLALHQKQTLFLMSFAFQELTRRIENGTLRIEIEDYERLTKMYYQVLDDPSKGNVPDVMEMFIRASKYQKIAPLNQGSMEFSRD